MIQMSREYNKMKKYSELDKLEKLIISKFADSRQRRTPHGSDALQYNINERLYTCDEVTSAIANLTANKIIEKNSSGDINIELEYYRYLWRLPAYNIVYFAKIIKHKIIILWDFLWSHFVVTIITSVIVAYIVTKFIKSQS
jgi:hypothetical protein